MEDIKKRICTPKLHISRIDPKTYKKFIEYANEDFCGDYGNLLKHLLDFYFGLIPTGTEHIEQELLILQERIAKLEQSNLKEEKPVRKTLGGRSIK